MHTEPCGHSTQSTLSATALAQFGKCERLALYEHLHGKSHSSTSEAVRHRGLVDHEAYHRQALVAVAASNKALIGRWAAVAAIFRSIWLWCRGKNRGAK